MALFDRYLAVDWSARNVPATGKDTIWIAEAHRQGGRLVLSASANPATRHAAMAEITATLRAARAAGERVMLGFDFVFGYPTGATQALTGAADWRALWALLASRIEDAPDNRSNRFALAAALNGELGPLGPAFWGHPHGQSVPGLAPTRPAHDYPHLRERRLAESRSGGAQPVWKLTGAGAVGSQTLLGIPRLQALRTDPTLGPDIAVWPFDTAFAADLSRPITLVEIYPSLLPLSPDAPNPRDRAQVEACVTRFAELDAADQLQTLLSAPPDLASADLAAVLAEEGWIAGIGHEALLRAPPAATPIAYLRDPAAIYAQSFATIAAEAELSQLPPALRPAAIRMIHACGMVDLAADIVGDASLPAAVRAALTAGAPILCDCEMVHSGVIARLLPAHTERLVTLNDPRVPDLAKALGTTRSAAALELWRDKLAGAIVLIGNAPTALFHLLDMLGQGAPRPAAIIAAPVGFVGAAESKALLVERAQGIPFITVLGRRGGSAITSAALNALAGAAQ